MTRFASLAAFAAVLAMTAMSPALAAKKNVTGGAQVIQEPFRPTQPRQQQKKPRAGASEADCHNAARAAHRGSPQAVKAAVRRCRGGGLGAI